MDDNSKPRSTGVTPTFNKAAQWPPRECKRFERLFRGRTKIISWAKLDRFFMAHAGWEYTRRFDGYYHVFVLQKGDSKKTICFHPQP